MISGCVTREILLDFLDHTPLSQRTLHIFGCPYLGQDKVPRLAANASPCPTPRIPVLTPNPHISLETGINSAMKLLGHIRSRSRLKSTDDPSTYNKYQPRPVDKSIGLSKSHPSARFSTTLLHELFSYVCPHSRDDSYASCEDSMIDGGCMLCDMRDLSQCALVNRQWSEAAQNLL